MLQGKLLEVAQSSKEEQAHTEDARHLLQQRDQQLSEVPAQLELQGQSLRRTPDTLSATAANLGSQSAALAAHLPASQQQGA
jgi:hypothetical protein